MCVEIREGNPGPAPLSPSRKGEGGKRENPVPFSFRSIGYSAGWALSSVVPGNRHVPCAPVRCEQSIRAESYIKDLGEEREGKDRVACGFIINVGRALSADWEQVLGIVYPTMM